MKRNYTSGNGISKIRKRKLRDERGKKKLVLMAEETANIVGAKKRRGSSTDQKDNNIGRR